MDPIAGVLDRPIGARTPGLQYVAVRADGPLYAYAGGWADVGARRPMTPDTTLLGCSMTKTLTAVAVLQGVERGDLSLDDPLERHAPDTPYAGAGVTVRHLLAHTSGLPNPIPLRWAHLVEEAPRFDEAAALDRVLRAHPRLASPPGQRWAYSNLGYWLLGRIVARAAGKPFVDCVRESILAPLRLPPSQLDFALADPSRHAGGYLARRSLLNLVKGFVTDRRFWGEREGKWLRIRDHYVDGPAFGGLVGTAHGFGRFLQDQLGARSVLLGPDARRLLTEPQGSLPMTLGWHVRTVDGARCLYKIGGGAGFRSEMRLYPEAGVGSVVLTNATQFDTSALLAQADRALLGRG